MAGTTSLAGVRLRVAILIGVVLGGCLRGSAQTAVLYAASGNGNYSSLYTVDPTTAQATLVGPVLAGATQLIITGMSFHPTTGVLYGVTGRESGPVRQLVTINPATGQAVIIGSLGFGSSDISFDANGTLYSWTTNGGPLGTVNLGTGAQTQLGSTMNGSNSNGLSFTPSGTLYVAGGTFPGNLLTVNPANGTTSLVAALSNVPVGFGRVNSLASDLNGVMFATGNSGGGQLLTINLTTGVATTIGVLGFEADALAFNFVQVPEPSTWALLVCGGCLILLMAWRNRPS